ncbi:unnamed protein product, partial [Pleuronectes platessa]
DAHVRFPAEFLTPSVFVFVHLIISGSHSNTPLEKDEEEEENEEKEEKEEEERVGLYSGIPGTSLLGAVTGATKHKSDHVRPQPPEMQGVA